MSPHLTVLAEVAENELPMPAWAFGATALFVLLFLLAVTWSFRSIGHRHAPLDSANRGPDHHDGAHDGQGSAGTHH